uniref:JmjC domain-containing protein n=1 Tax=Panagrolaimus superbus TaxID=310955 RepID=A0A914YG36_9BILA
MRIRVPEFWITSDEMRADGLPETFDFLRFKKGAENYPFLCIHTDDAFLAMLALDNIDIPQIMDASSTSSKIKNLMPGVYKMSKSEVPPEIGLDDDGIELPPLSGKEIVMEHLEKMKHQEINGDLDEATFLQLSSRQHLENQSLFLYKENIAFSILNGIATSNPDFPQKWNFDNIDGPLKSFCSGNDGLNEILGVSTSMIYAGERGTYSSLHVEDADYPSANILFPGSAGKAWIGIHPEDQNELDDYIRNQFRSTCASPTLHKDLVVDIDLLERLNLRWYYFIQRPGDIIVTTPSAPHQVINLGYNLAEAMNFYASRHLVAARRRIACNCPSRLKRYDNAAWKRLASFVYSGEFQFLCKVNGIPVSTPEDILTQLVDEFSQLNQCFGSTSSAPLTVADVINEWTQKHLQDNPDERDVPELSTPAVTCEIMKLTPLDLDSLKALSPVEVLPPRIANSPPPRIADPPSTIADPPSTIADPPSTIADPPSTIADPPSIIADSLPRIADSPPHEERRIQSQSRSPTPRSNTPQPPSRSQSRDIFELSSPIQNPRGRKRTTAATLGENPDAKQKRNDARADYWSQRAWERGEYGRRQHQDAKSVASEPPSNADSRTEAATRIKKNAETYRKYKKSRVEARERYDKKNPKQPKKKNSSTSAWFKDYMQRATRKIANAEAKIAEYAARGTQPRTCCWEEKLQSASATKQNLERRRLLHNVLQTMYRYCSADLQQRLDEGYLEQEIFRDFVLFNSKENMDLLRAALTVHHADFSYWSNVLENEEAWNEEFGVDYNYRIPCVEFSKLKIQLLDFL